MSDCEVKVEGKLSDSAILGGGSGSLLSHHSDLQSPVSVHCQPQPLTQVSTACAISDKHKTNMFNNIWNNTLSSLGRFNWAYPSQMFVVIFGF